MERSVNPDFREFSPAELKTKLFRNLPRFFQWELPRLGGSWITAFFLAGLMVPFRSPRLSRMRNLLVLFLVGAVLVQSLAAPAIFSEGMAEYADPVLVTFAPLVFVFGASLVLTLYRQLASRAPRIRFEVLGSLCLLIALPLLLHFLHPVRSQLAFPPYYPRWIQEKAAFLEDNDWCMSDIPGAMAWYGDRPSVLWPDLYKSPGTGRYPNDFYEIHQRFKAIRGLYLSSAAMNEVKTEPLFEWIARTEESTWEETVFDWEAFILVGILLKNEVPQDFPLKNAPFGIYPELFLVDSERIEGKSIQTP